MKQKKLLETIQNLQSNTDNQKEKQKLTRFAGLIAEIGKKPLPGQEDIMLYNELEPQLQPIETTSQALRAMKNLRSVLMKKFGFIPPNYFTALCVGIGLALGTGLGIAFGVLIEDGMIYGQMTGSCIGLVVGLVVGLALDSRKKQDDLVLYYL